MDRQGNGAESLARKLLLLGNQMVAIAGDLEGPRNPVSIQLKSSIQSTDGRNNMVDAKSNESIEWSSDGFWAQIAENMYSERRMRERFFPKGLFEEPAWDMLLDLYIAEHQNKRVLTTSACIGANAALTTGLRYIDKLEGLGLVERENDLEDGRRTIVRISKHAFSILSAYFADSWSRRLQNQRNSRVVRKAGPHQYVANANATKAKSAFFEESNAIVT